MNVPLRVALLTLLLAAPAQAQDQSAQPRIEIETNLFCDTQHQVERFVMHFNGNGRNAEAAIEAVNEEMQAADSCVIATAAYRSAEQVSTVRDDDAVFDVVQIVVVGVQTLNGLEQSLPTEFFTLIPREDDSRTIGQRP
jgi:hypothetical protein